MKKFLLGCAIAMCGLPISNASAQDLCCPTQCDPCCYGMDFNGLYFGGNLGAFSHTAHRNDEDGFLTDNSGWSTNRTSFEAGVQLGYDWQCCNTLFGIVGDWNWVRTRHHVKDDPNGGGLGGHRSRAQWFSTIRVRAGLAVCDATVYVTGGAAVTRFRNRWDDGVLNTFNDHHTRWGWTGGAGTEFLLGCNWSLGLEVLFLHFDDHRRTFTRVDGVPFEFTHSDSSWVGRVLLNYRFGDLCSCFL
jgi:outer membrane immunogenic protein